MNGEYTHWQPGTLIRVTLAIGLGLTAAVAIVLTSAGVPWFVSASVVGLVAVTLLACLIAFHGLGAEVTREHVKVWFGPKWISRQLDTREIVEVREVRNSWWMGWGIRWIGRGTTMWNVSGLDAVELELRSGRRFRIGTDDPHGLAAAIREMSGAGGHA